MTGGARAPSRTARVARIGWAHVRWPLALTGLVYVPLVIWFAGFKPGIMTNDSLNIWHQALEGRWTDAHPPAYIVAMRVSQLLVDSPSLLTLAQQLLLASSLAHVAIALRRIGVSAWAAYGALGLVACSPMVGAFSVSVWKDVPYAAFLVHLGAALVELAWAQITGHRHAANVALATAGVAAFGATHSRQNGILMITALAAILIVTLRGRRRHVALAWLALASSVVVAKTLIYPAVGIRPSPPELTVASLLHDLGAVVYHEPHTLDREDRLLLEQLAPLDVWRDFYNCYTVDWLYYRAGLDFDRMDELRDDIVSQWREALFEAPGTIIGHRICAGSIAWRPFAVDRRVSVLYTVSAGVDPNDFGLHTDPLANSINEFGLDLLREVGEPQREWFLWRAPTWIYAAYVAVGYAAWRRRRWQLLLAITPLAAQQLSVIALNPAQDARYMMGGLMLGMLLVPAALIPDQPAVRPAGDGALGNDAASQSTETDSVSPAQMPSTPVQEPE